ncbi:MAG: SDR family NAD(P)-dependent oxidoreductase, partial [Muribaculaceae bacterium]|nr:SDR family NAD(P)-dependent oxidoreductase [Muribaculaceae bacterium]
MKIDNLFDLTGKVAVVTGGGDGIGKESCRILAAAGASVIVSDLSLKKAETVAMQINEEGGNATSVACDVSKEEDLINLIDFAVKTYDTVNILVNNAGVGGGGRENPFNIDLKYVERIYAINVFAPWLLCKLSAPYMQKSGYGSIVNITSMSSINNSPSMAIYGSSKAALNH